MNLLDCRVNMSTIVFKGTRSSRSNTSIYRWVRRVLTSGLHMVPSQATIWRRWICSAGHSRLTASGMPCASVMRWCFEPGRAQSVGFGPIFDRHPRPEWKRNRQCSATSQSGRLGAVVPVARRASPSRPRLPARPKAVASNSCQNHNPVPWAAFHTECCSGAQTESPPEPHDHPLACVRGAWLGAAWVAAR